MGKRLKALPALLLCLALLTTAVFAAGGAEDPLVSLSHVRDVFLPALRESLSEMAQTAAAASRAEREAIPPAMMLWELEKGERLCLDSGEQMIVLSGTAELELERGEVVNATLGRTSTGGTLRENHRYIICEDAAAAAAAEGSVRIWASSGAEKTAAPQETVPQEQPAPPQFGDVPEDAWFYRDVYRAVERGLVNGMSADSFAPQGKLTAAQCVKLAACMHQLYHEGGVTLAPAEVGPWYAPYLAYAEAAGILTEEYADYDADLDRRGFVALFYRAMPEEAYMPVNAVDAIPDMEPGEARYDEILCFYRAGILSGYSNTPGYAEHAFGPESSITRAEVAAIMNRMFDPEARVLFTIE